MPAVAIRFMGEANSKHCTIIQKRGMEMDTCGNCHNNISWQRDFPAQKGENWKFIHPSIFHPPLRICWFCHRTKVGYILDKLPVHRWATLKDNNRSHWHTHTHTYRQFRFPLASHGCVWTMGRSRSNCKSHIERFTMKHRLCVYMQSACEPKRKIHLRWS